MLLILLELLDLYIQIVWLNACFLVLLQLLVESLETLPFNCEVSRGLTRAFNSIPLIVELILDLVEALEVEKDIDDFPAIIEPLFDQPLEILLSNNAARNNLIIRYPSQQPL